MNIRYKIRYIAMAISLVYAVVRVVIVNATLSGYGINPWIFLIIDAVTGVTYVLAIEYLIVSIVQKTKTRWQHTFVWSLIAVISFGLPYAYIFIASHELPLSFAAGLGLIILLLLINALLTIRRRVRSKKGE